MKSVYKENGICIAVFTNAKDYYFAKICIASIRYYYPEIEIYLVKDLLHGFFNTSLLRKKFRVKLLKLDKCFFGWGASKIHFILENKIAGKKILMLDADIVFLGKVLNNFKDLNADFVIVPENLKEPLSSVHQSYYLNPNDGKALSNDYEYPGFCFNSGQLLVTPSKIPSELFQPVFDKKKYPYFLRPDIFHTVDQSVLNFILPIAANRNLISVAQIPFMRWSVRYFENQENDSPTKYFNDGIPLLIHYCGDVRNYKFQQMKGKNTLKFFKSFLLEHYSPIERILNYVSTRIVSNSHYNTYFKNFSERFFLRD